MPPILSVVVAMCAVGVFSDDAAGPAGIWICDGAISCFEFKDTAHLAAVSIVSPDQMRKSKNQRTCDTNVEL